MLTIKDRVLAPPSGPRAAVAARPARHMFRPPQLAADCLKRRTALP